MTTAAAEAELLCNCSRQDSLSLSLFAEKQHFLRLTDNLKSTQRHLLLFNLFSVRKQNKNSTNQDYPLHDSNIYDFSKIATDQNLNDFKISSLFNMILERDNESSHSKIKRIPQEIHKGIVTRATIEVAMTPCTATPGLPP